MQIGVLSIQGDVAENIAAAENALTKLDESGTVKTVKTPQEIDTVDGLIIPGGESTMMGQLSLVNGAQKMIDERQSILGLDVNTLELRMQERGGKA